MKTARMTVVLLAAVAVSVVLSVSYAADDRTIRRNNDAAERRLALVIGNSAYKSSPLKNPVNDARAIEKTLKSLGFTVWKHEDLSYQMMMKSVDDFGDELLKGGGVGLFYYAGHGIQYNGRNFLIPTDAEISRENEIQYKSVDGGLVLAKMENARNRLNIVILDACRDNPFARSFRSAAQGLAFMDAPTGTIIAYATSPGKTASDGSGSNGLYTSELIRQMKMPGQSITDMFMNVRKEVRGKSDGKQVPWESTSLEGNFYFADSGSIATEKPKPPIESSMTVKPQIQSDNKPKYALRSKPISTDEPVSVFKLDESKKPLEYIQNNFKDNGDGTITDRATGLMWEKLGSNEHLKYENATAYIDELNRKRFAGYDDWRLPTVDELKSLLTPEKMNGELYVDPLFDKTQTYCWTSDKRTGGSWIVIFKYGGVYCHGLLVVGYVRAVRSLQ